MIEENVVSTAGAHLQAGEEELAASYATAVSSPSRAILASHSLAEITRAPICRGPITLRLSLEVSVN